MISKVQELIDFQNKLSLYSKSYFCKTNTIIHPNIKSVLKCKDCVTSLDSKIYEFEVSIEELFNKFDNYMKELL